MEDHNTQTTDIIEVRSSTIKLEDGGSGCRRRKAKPKTTTSRKERRRTQNINAAFEDLRKHIPNVPSDTKLSKIKTLKLAMSYIHHLEHQLEDETIGQETNRSTEETSIKTESPQRNSNSNAKPVEAQQSAEEKTRHSSPRRSSRTGWPQHVWALELLGSLKQQSVV